MTSMDQPGSMSPEQATRAPRVAMNDKLDSICSLIENLNLTPKEFVVAFLEQNHDNVAFRRRYWGTEKGWDSTLRLILGIKRLANTHMEGRRLWEELILSEATEIVSSQKPKSGLAPKGAYHNSSTLTESFFSMEELATWNANLVEQMPFLYKLLCSKILGNGTQPTACASQDPMEDLSDEEDAVDLEDNIDDMDGIVLRKHRDPVARRANRVKTMARTICAMVAFGRNRRHNGFQLSNSLIFLAAGVKERVSSYLNYIGVSSSRRTAHAALHTLGKEAEATFRARYKLEQSPLIAPLLCYDNLDFQEKVHMKSITHTSKMFHGTWGYIHSIPPSLWPKLNPAELTKEALMEALHAGSKLCIRPEMFTPTKESTVHWQKTQKSQITRVILQYLAKPGDSRVPLQRTAPEVHPITPEDPNISMLRLMIASDNSAQGVGDVFTGIIQQSGLTAKEFHSRLQLIEGDLGSCNIFDSLRKQRCPATGNHNSLDNVLPIPGAAHTMWNISQAVFLAHWGNEKLACDTGAWRVLHALGIPANKPVTKKDFNLMLCHVEKIHEATLLYCVLLVANRSNQPLSDDQLVLSTETIEHWVDLTYDRFCSRDAFLTDLATSSPSHMNMLLRIRDFATIIEANRAMKDGDYGRLMYMWERWAVMTQGLGKMPHYSKHLPKLIIELKFILPKSMAQVIFNTLLISPSLKAGHFVATDQYLEVLNYWLKYFFNNSGIGTNIDRLKDVFSSSIGILRYLLQLIKIESGAEVVHQSHKNRLSLESLNNFRQMAESVGMGLTPAPNEAAMPVVDCYVKGILKLQQEYMKSGLNRLRPYSPGIMAMEEEDKLRASRMAVDHPVELNAHNHSDDNNSNEDDEQDQGTEEES
ncbi:hypothetical protein PGTUg99_012284 [Puccinia graminis f. sp. tritici]|uniref:DUF6589 domain-containing protein n=2 Tax=Puccinia graminis f. sp. tritici TaxID=56615 RepID=A0A5B0RHM5_PUCGR|nr:hypothetical protein PGTUg99_012284 [Puccinia graminis f. sp. tritici]